MGHSMKNRLRFNLFELSGSLADIGVFMPLAIGLIKFNHVNPTSLFLAAGLLYIIAGIYFKIPMPVQPLKAASIIAITIGASAGEISAAALIMGILFVLIAYLQLSGLFVKIFSRPIVRGIQLSLGILLAKKGIMLFAGEVFSAASGVIVLFGKGIPVSLVLGIIAVSIIFISKDNRRIPSALILVFIGVVVSLLTFILSSNHFVSGPIKPQLFYFRAGDLYTAFFVLLLPQIPLTIANSVVATKDTAITYFRDKAKRVSMRALCTSLGLSNIISGIIGGMPMCHGSGGITAHYRFGARTGRANIFIGGIFIIIALLFDKSAAGFFSLFPVSILSIMLIYIGIEHAKLLRDIIKIPSELSLSVAVASISLVSGSLAMGFGCGVALNLLTRGYRVIRGDI